MHHYFKLIKFLIDTVVTREVGDPKFQSNWSKSGVVTNVAGRTYPNISTARIENKIYEDQGVAKVFQTRRTGNF